MGAFLPLYCRGLQGLSLKGLMRGCFSLGFRGVLAYFGCVREHVDALGSSAQDVNVLRLR